VSMPEAVDVVDAHHWSNEIGKRAPNILTFIRLLLVPVFVVFLIDPTPTGNMWAAGIFVFASLTDWLDGYLARVFNAESILGTLMDPLADKILVTAALIMLAADPNGARAPAWIVVVLLSRDMIITGLRSLAATQGTVVAASRWAKHKTAWSMLAIAFLLVGEPYVVAGILIDFQLTGIVFLWIALIYSVTTGVDYFLRLRGMFT